MIRSTLIVGALLGALLIAGQPAPAAADTDPSMAAVLTHYADIAEAKYNDALTTAKSLQTTVDRLIAEGPGDDAHRHGQPLLR